MMMQGGTRLGPYEILSPLGAGGMGEVWKARDTRVDRLVALKVLPGDFSEGKEGEERKERFGREAHALASLNHPNIATLYSFEEIPRSPGSSPRHILVMELLEGSTLREAVLGRRLGPRDLVDYGLQIADGLAAAHAKGIVHRDLKPENLFVTSDGRVKILDFGLARAAGPASEIRTESVTEALTTAGHVFGTVPYMAPEQLRGERADARSDLFSFGTILYEMASGRRPFAGRSPAETASAILKDDPQPLEVLRPDLPESFRHVVARCLEKDPARRPQTAIEVQHRLRGLEDELRAGVGRPAAVSPEAGRHVRWTLVAIAAVLVVFAAVLVPRLRSPSPPAPGSPVRSIAVLPFDNLAKDPSQDYFVDGMHEALITDLAKLGMVRVTSRTTVMRYRGAAKSLKEIAADLDVDALIEGSVLRSGNRVRITAQLIRGATDEHLWAESYDRDLENVLQLLTDVSRAIAGEVRLRMAGGAGPWLPPAPSPAPKVRPEAWEAYLKSHQTVLGMTSVSKADLEAARDGFRRAVELDPGFARGWSGLAGANLLLGFFRLAPQSETIPQARAAAEKAAALDAVSGEALGILGTIELYYDWKFDLARQHLERAVSLAPHDPLVRHAWADWLMAMGRLEESYEQMRIARSNEPTSPLALGTFLFHALAARRFDEVIDEGHRAQAAFPQLAMAYSTAGEAYWMKGRYEESIAEYRKVPGAKAEEMDVFEANLKRDGPRAAMRADAERLAARYQPGRSNPLLVAGAFANSGDRDRTFEWLEKAFEQRMPQILHVPGDPSFDAVKDDPRYGALLQRIGIPLAPPAR